MSNDVSYTNKYAMNTWHLNVKISAKYLGIEDICLDKFDYMYTITIKENVDHKSTFTCSVSSLRE